MTCVKKQSLACQMTQIPVYISLLIITQSVSGPASIPRLLFLCKPFYRVLLANPYITRHIHQQTYTAWWVMHFRSGQLQAFLGLFKLSCHSYFALPVFPPLLCFPLPFSWWRSMIFKILLSVTQHTSSYTNNIYWLKDISPYIYTWLTLGLIQEHTSPHTHTVY